MSPAVDQKYKNLLKLKCPKTKMSIKSQLKTFIGIAILRFVLFKQSHNSFSVISNVSTYYFALCEYFLIDQNSKICSVQTITINNSPSIISNVSTYYFALCEYF